MFNPEVSERPELHWFPVTGADGRVHMEAHWIVPSETHPAASAA